MGTLNIRIPGGLLVDGNIENDIKLNELGGVIEAKIAELTTQNENPPRNVTEILAQYVSAVGAHGADIGMIRDLTVADRQYIMMNLLQRIEGDELWLRCACQSCNGTFDIGLERSCLPVKPAGDGFPFTNVEIGGRIVYLKVPTGGDQENIALLEKNRAIDELVRSSIISISDLSSTEEMMSTLDENGFYAIEEALEKISPAIAVRTKTQCPECGAAQTVSFNPFVPARSKADDFYQEVHVLALNYHWSKNDILGLSREQRQMYIAMIERSLELCG